VCLSTPCKTSFRPYPLLPTWCVETEREKEKKGKDKVSQKVDVTYWKLCPKKKSPFAANSKMRLDTFFSWCVCVKKGEKGRIIYFYEERPSRNAYSSFVFLKDNGDVSFLESHLTFSWVQM
jgi:hypothetical protein